MAWRYTESRRVYLFSEIASGRTALRLFIQLFSKTQTKV